jgi:hypothetical protein
MFTKETGEKTLADGEADARSPMAGCLLLLLAGDLMSATVVKDAGLRGGTGSARRPEPT